MFKMSFNIYEYISDLYINVYINNNAKGILIFIQWKTFRYRLATVCKYDSIRHFVDSQQQSVSFMRLFSGYLGLQYIKIG